MSSPPQPIPSSPARPASLKAQEFQDLFNIPSDQLRGHFACAYVDIIRYHGRLYVGRNHVCFHSSIFGTTKLVIPLSHISAVNKKKSLSIIPDTIELVCKRSQSDEAEAHVFASMVNRDKCFDLIMSLLAAARRRSSSALLTPPTTPSSRPASTTSTAPLGDSPESALAAARPRAESAPTTTAATSTAAVAAVAPADGSDRRRGTGQTTPRSRTLTSPPPLGSSPRPVGVPVRVCEHMLSTSPTSSMLPPPPMNVPPRSDTGSHIQQEIVGFSCSDIQQLLFLSNQFYDHCLALAGYKRIESSAWSTPASSDMMIGDEPCCQHRDITCEIPLTGIRASLGSSIARMRQRQHMSACHDSSGFVVMCETLISDVPYSDSFSTSIAIACRPTFEGAQLDCWWRVVWSQKPMFVSGMIEKAAIQDNHEFWTIFVTSAIEWLHQTSRSGTPTVSPVTLDTQSDSQLLDHIRSEPAAVDVENVLRPLRIVTGQWSWHIALVLLLIPHVFILWRVDAAVVRNAATADTGVVSFMHTLMLLYIAAKVTLSSETFTD